MTIHAEFKIRGFELKNLFFGWAMAVVALCRDVSPSERKARLAMIKALVAFVRTPGVRGVADGALFFKEFFAEDADVRAFVTILAGLSREIWKFVDRHLCGLNGMTVLAF